ncbi:MAG: N-acetyltransferase family protein [Kordiimonas sp.]
MSIEIRPANGRTEIAASFTLVQKLAAHENSLQYLRIDETTFIEAASKAEPQIYILIALLNGNIVGVATYFKRFHIWNGTEIFELDDLFVSPNARGKGIGTQLLKELSAIAKDLGSPIKWQVNADNENAIALYKRMGADYNASGICFWRPENM